MANVRSLGGGLLLASGNIYGSVAAFAVLSIVFNSIDLRTFGSLSLLLTAVAICQVLFNTQSWQGLLNASAVVNAVLLKRCLFIDVSASSFGALTLFVLFSLFHSTFASSAVFMLIILNVAFVPPGAAVAAIRHRGLFAVQALVDIIASSLKLALAILWLSVERSLSVAVWTLVIPEFVRWLGYIGILASCLLNDSNTKNECSKGLGESTPRVASIYSFSMWGMLTEIIHLPTAHFDKLLVSAILGLESLAIWDILKRCAMAVVQGTSVVNQVLFPQFLRMRGEFNQRKLVNVCVRQCMVLTCGLLTFYGLALLAFPIWFPFAFKVASVTFTFGEIQMIFGLLGLVMSFVLGATPIHPLFLSLNHSSINFRISLWGNIVFFGLSAILLPSIGLWGAPLAILGSDAAIIATKFRMLRQNVH